MYEGVGNYIRGITEDVGNRVSPAMKLWANEIFQIIGFDHHRHNRQGVRSNFLFEKDGDGILRNLCELGLST